MKTNKEWLEELPEPIRSEALANLDTHINYLTLLDAIYSSFVWASTKEGHDYWAEIAKDIEADEFKEYRREDFEWEVEQEEKDNLTQFED